MSTISILPPAVQSYVHDFDARARRLALLRGVGLALAVFVIWMLVCCGIDRVAKLEPTVRLCLLGAGLLAVAVILARPVRNALRRRVDWVEAADRIERHSPQFGQRLVTVTSRVLGPAEHRGSDDMLRELLREVDRQAATQDAADLLPLRKIARPWLVLLAALVAGLGLLRVPGFGMDVLAARFLAPLADVQPVTTTQIDVLTGSRDVIQSEPLVIEADVVKLRGGVVSLLVSEDAGAHWSRSTMAAVTETQPTTATSVDGAVARGNIPEGATSLDAGPQTRPAAPGATRYTFTLASVDRDLHYHVTGGDAASRTYAVRVRRPPAVERFRVHYEYPAYTGRTALTVVNTDGVIEAPAGTRATLTIVATEPLDKALLTLGGEKTLMTPPSGDVPAGEDPDRVRQASFVIRKNGKYELDLISDRDVPGGGPATTLIRATPDGKPLVRLAQAGENLRLHPREILPLGYEALDDYGIAKLVLRAQVNSAAPVETAIGLHGDARRQAEEHEFDLATMQLGIGDVLTLHLTATDRAGQTSMSEPVQVLVSPRSVDLTTYQRVAEMNAAAALATTLHEQLTGAAQALEEVDREAAARSLAYTAARNRSARQLTDAAQTATLMRQALFRGLVNSRTPELSNTLATWIDHAEAQSWLAEDLFRRSGAPKGMGPGPRDLLAQALEAARVLRDELKLAAGGERAAALQADRENLVASQKKADAEQAADVKQRLLQTLQRAQEEIAAGAREIGLDPAIADLDNQLKARVEGALALLKSKGSIDFATASQAWAQALQADPTQPVMLDERLAAAAQAEAVRADGDLVRASDLQLAARAAGRIELLAQPDPNLTPAGPPAFAEFAGAVAAVQREHELNRRPLDVRPPEESKQVRDGARAAREVLRRWAGDIPDPASTRPVLAAARSRQKQAEELALRAGAEAAARNYEAAAALDAEMARALREAGENPLSTRPGGGDVRVLPAASDFGPLGPPAPSVRIEQRQRQVGLVMEKARAIDEAGQQQDTVAKQTETAKPEQAPGLAGQQREVAEAIARVDGPAAGASASALTGGDAAAADPNWRGRAAAAVLAAQESFALMPQQLAAAQEALPAWRDAIMRAEQAKKDAASMPAERQPAAQRAAAQADADAVGAAERFQARRQPVSAGAAGQLSAALEPFVPETNGAVDVITRALVPALQRLEEAAKAGDVAAFTRAADEARQSIEATQKELAFAQESLTARDPLVAAKWFARAAADSLARTPPDLRAAQVRQKETSNALSRAWDRTIHDAAAMRMASLPAMRSLYAPADAPPDPAKAAAAAASGQAPPPDPAALLAPGLAAVREWAKLRPREPQDLSAAMRGDSEPPGFEEALRVYFESLGKTRAEPPKQAAQYKSPGARAPRAAAAAGPSSMGSYPYDVPDRATRPRATRPTPPAWRGRPARVLPAETRAGRPRHARGRRVLPLLLACLMGSSPIPPTSVLGQATAPAPVQPPQPLPARLDESVARGLEYLANQQNPDGSFAIGRNPDGSAGTVGGPPLAMTGLTLLAFLAAGHAPDVGRHGLVVTGAVDHLLDRVPDNGYVGAPAGDRGDASRMYGQGIVTLGLAEAYGVERDRNRRLRIYAALNKLVTVILTAQSVQKAEPYAGGWRYTPDAPDSDLSLSGWNALALRACQEVGLNVPKDAVDRAAQFVVKCQNPTDKGFAYQPGGVGEAGPTGIGVLSLYLLDAAAHPGLADAEKFLAQAGAQPQAKFPYYNGYYVVQAALQAGEPTWGAVSRPTFDALIAGQLPDGGWPPSPYGEEPGRVYSTALAVLTLSVPYRLLPIYQR